MKFSENVDAGIINISPELPSHLEACRESSKRMREHMENSIAKLCAITDEAALNTRARG